MTEFTPEQIEDYKKQFGGCHKINVTTRSGKKLLCYIKPPQTRNAMAVIMMRLQSKQYVEAGEFIMSNCWIAGDDLLRSPGSSYEEQNASVKAALLAINAFDMADGDFVKND